MRQSIALALASAAMLSGCAAEQGARPAPAAEVAAVDVRRAPASPRALDAIAADYLAMTLQKMAA